MPRFGSRLYTTGKIVFDKATRHHVYVPVPEGCLYSGGTRLVKYSENDLPEWFSQVYVWRCNGYLNAKDVKHLLYAPNFFTDHEYKDDLLYVSYKRPIVPDIESYQRMGKDIPEVDCSKGISNRGAIWYANYDYIISGPTIVSFVEAVKEYNPDFPNIDHILFEMRNKPAIIRVNEAKNNIRSDYLHVFRVFRPKE